MPPRNISLSAYLAYARGNLTGAPEDLPNPTSGPVVWAHADQPEQGRSLGHLCNRLLLQRPELCIAVSGSVPKCKNTTHVRLPSEHPAECDQFIARLNPTILLWSGSNLRPSLIHSAKKAGTHLCAVDIRDTGWTSPAPKWLPDPKPATFGQFDRLHAVDRVAVNRLRRVGIETDSIFLSAPLLDVAQPLPADEVTLTELSTALSGRPIWMAAHLRAAEAEDILRAHRHALKLAHRLLLVMVPESEDAAAGIAQSAQAAQMRICHWDQGESPDENTQIILLESPDELGLWYRIAPLSFLGGSLVSGFGGHDPFEAAALGTAILYGPNVGNHLGAYSRLVEAGGARIVRDADSLGAAVSHCIAPDQSASMAHAGWHVISSGAETVDRVMRQIFDALDQKEPA